MLVGILLSGRPGAHPAAESDSSPNNQASHLLSASVYHHVVAGCRITRWLVASYHHIATSMTTLVAGSVKELVHQNHNFT